MHGAFLKKTLEKEKIGVLNLIEDEHYFTTLAFVAIDENGEREFSFSRKPGADTKLQADELNLELLQNCKIFHFGSLHFAFKRYKMNVYGKRISKFMKELANVKRRIFNYRCAS